MTGALGRWLANRPLNTKLLLVIAVLGAVTVGLGVLSIARMQSISHSTESLYDSGLVPLHQVDSVRNTMADVRVATLSHALSNTRQDKDRFTQAIAQADAAFAKQVVEYRATSVAPELVDQLATAWKSYQDGRVALLAASDRGDVVAVGRIRDQLVATHVGAANKLIDDLVARERADASARRDEAVATYRSARNVTVVVLVAGVTLAVLFGLYVGRGIVTRVRRVSHVVEGLAEGDLTRTADVDSRDEIGAMAARLDAATGRLREVMTEVTDNSEGLAGAARELSTASTQIAGAAEQASARADGVSSAAEEVSANIATVAAASEEMTASIREIAGSATDAAGVARGAVTVAESANVTVSKLGQSSAEIGNIVSVIT